MNTYDIDTLVTVQSAFATADGGAIDPSTVTLYVRDPSGAEQTVAMGDLTHVGTGVFSYGLQAGLSGIWFYKWQGGGDVEVTSPDTAFFVRASKLIAG